MQNAITKYNLSSFSPFKFSSVVGQRPEEMDLISLSYVLLRSPTCFSLLLMKRVIHLYLNSHQWVVARCTAVWLPR